MPAIFSAAVRESSPFQWERNGYEARTLLRDTDLPLARIAELCGFCNAYYLSNRFRQTMGLSPREWRKERI